MKNGGLDKKGKNTMEYISVIVIKNDVVEENHLRFSPKEAENLFFEKCAQYISNWDEYTPEDRDGILDDGYEKFGHGSVCISWPEKPETVE